MYINPDTGIADLAIDPSNSKILYAAAWEHRRLPYYFRSGGEGSALHKSADGGKTFETIFRGAHPDHHVVWVDPSNSQHIISGNDGGLDISWDGGRHSHAVQAAAWAEVYNGAYDMRDPYYVYVGLQDNGNWGGPSNSRDRAGILLPMWYPCGGGDGFYTQVDPEEWYVL